MTAAATEVVRPDDVTGLSAALRDSAPGTVGIRGAGTKRDWGGPAHPVDLEVDVGAISGIVEHNPGDLVVTARAGTPLADVQAAVGEHGQWLALDPPEAGATLGGIVATRASGPRRHRYGTARDLLIGVTAVLADGTVARAGGKVVKNVAGYDLMKLYAGSYGTLGVVAETTWRLHPRAPDRRVVTFPAVDAALLLRLLHSPLTPVAMEVDGEQLVVVFESLTASVTAQAEAAAALGGAAGTGVVGTDLPAGFGARPWAVAGIGLVLAYEIAGVDLVLDAVRRLRGPRISGRVGVGVLEVGLDALEPGELNRLRAAIAPVGGTAVVLVAPAQTKRVLDVWGPVGDAMPLMRRVKDQFDPGHRLAPGRFVGGI